MVSIIEDDLTSREMAIIKNTILISLNITFLLSGYYKYIAGSPVSDSRNQPEAIMAE
jgi:hypothetical protein